MSVVLWWLTAQIIAISALPLCLTLFRPLADRGYGLSKAFGLLLFGYLAWLLGLSHLVPNGALSLLIALLLLAAASYFLVWRRDSRDLRRFWQQRKGLILLEEGLLLAAYLGFLVIRARNADISGTEKFMDFAFMNAITRSFSFPPLDPWLAPSPTIPDPTINYYHFGYLIQGLLLMATRVMPAVGFNLALSYLFAIAATGVFSLGYALCRDLFAETQQPRTRRAAAAGQEAQSAPVPPRERPARRQPAVPQTPTWSLRVAWPYAAGGLLTAYLLLVAGNLWTALRRFDGSGMWQKDFWSGIGWNATRVLVIKQGQNDLDYTINEFPSFSFLLGDLHPHVQALPFVLVAVGLAYTWLMRPPRLYRWAVAGEPLYDQPYADEAEDDEAEPPPLGWQERLEPLLEVLPGALLLGSLYFLNSWDFPGYFLLAQAGAIAGAYWQWRRGLGTPLPPTEEGEAGEIPEPSPFSWTRTVIAFGAVGLLSLALFLPFHLTFKAPVLPGGSTGERCIAVLCLVTQRSMLDQFLQFWGAQLLLLAPVLLAALGGVPLFRGALGGSIRRARAAAAVSALETPGWEPALFLGGGVLLVLLADRLGSGVLVLCLLVASAAGWAALRALDPAARIGGRPLAFALGAVCLAALLLATCEVVYIRDFYGGALRRMNTVFKFYYQAWLLLSVGGGAATFWLLRRLVQRRAEAGGKLALGAFSLAGALLFGATLMFPYKATLLRTDGFRAPATLDGMDWMRRFHPDDYAAAQWLIQHATAGGEVEPVVLEATGGPYSEFARIATQTGFPTILGWDQHESLWRGPGIGPELDTRKRDVDAIYRAGTLADAQPLLRKYHVRYVVSGYLEAQKYGGGSPDEQRQYLSRFDAMAATGGLEAVFRQGQTTIYKVSS